jgi:uncharacterized membrane protein
MKIYLPDREDDQVIIDRPIDFYVLVLTDAAYREIKDPAGLTLEASEKLQAGRIKLELIPKGVGRIVVRAASLYHEIKAGDSLVMRITVINDGTRALDNIQIATENPLNWKTVIIPDIITTLSPGKEQEVELRILPPGDVQVGAQELKIKTNATADNRTVKTEDKTLRIQVEARAPVFGTIILIVLLLGVLLGIVLFGIRMSKR